MTTAERLTPYYPFADDVLDAVENSAAAQNSKTFAELADAYGIANGPETVWTPQFKRPIEIVKLTPRGDFDENVLRVLHLPMANPVSPNKIMQAIRLFGADPSEALLVVGNPSIPGESGGTLAGRDALEMARKKDLRPTVEPLAEYIASLGVRRTVHIGYSYGAEKAVAASGVSAEFGLQVSRTVVMEPPAVVKRTLLRLMRDFGSSNAELQRYIREADSPPYQALRDQENTWGLVGYGLGLLRLSNIAIARTMTEPGFEDRAIRALETQPRMKLRVVWGSASELSPHKYMQQALNNLQRVFPDRVRGSVMRQMHHAGGDDIDLHAAMVLQSLRY